MNIKGKKRGSEPRTRWKKEKGNDTMAEKRRNEWEVVTSHWPLFIGETHDGFSHDPAPHAPTTFETGMT